MTVINQLDEKIKYYKKLKITAINLRHNIEDLQKEIERLEKLIETENINALDLKNEEVATIKLGDILEKMKEWTGLNPDELEISITVLNTFFNEKKEDIKVHRAPNQDLFSSRIKIKTKDGDSICNQEIPLFKNLDEIEADGYPLIDHCTIIETNYHINHLVITENIPDIICHFTLESVDYKNYDNPIFPRTIRKCIREGLAIETYEENPQKQLVKQR